MGAADRWAEERQYLRNDATEEDVASAYKLAWEMGADGAETDVFATADGVVVCLHDRNLKRTTGIDANVDEVTWDRIRELEAGAWKDERFRGEPVPLLADVLALNRGILVVRAESPWKTAREFIEDAKRRPGEISFSSSGVYGTLHMAVELLAHAAGIKLRHVPYAGAGPALTAILGGHVDALASGPAVVLPHVRAGKLRPLAGWGDQRVAALPEVPTFKELGYPDAEFYIWAGVFAPRGTPEPVLARLRDGLRTAVADPDFKAAMDKIETPIAFKQGAEFQAFFDADARRLAEGVRRVGKVEDKK